MKLSAWARKQGISYKTAWRWFKQGKLPALTRQLPTGTILVEEPLEHEGLAALYARVSSADQKHDLDRQIARLLRWANEHGLAIGMTVAEVGSGLNGKRQKLIRLLMDHRVKTIVVEHRDRLMRFGVECVEAALRSCGRHLLIAEPGEVKDDLVQDMIDVLTSFCARLYGKRSAQNRARLAVRAIQEGG